MKVLHISVRADQGGGPEHMYQLVSGLQKEQLQCYVACPMDLPYFERFQKLLGQASLLPIPHRSFSLSALFRLRRLVAENDVHCIHSHGKGAGLYSRLLGILCNKPVVHTFHGFHVEEYDRVKRFAYRIYESLFSLATRKVIFVSVGESSSIRSSLYFGLSNRAVVIYNGVANSAYADIVDARNRAVDVICVSRFNYQKNIFEFLSAIRCLTDAGVTLNVVVLGDGVDRGSSIEYSSRYKLPVAFLGNVSTPRDYFRQAKLLVSTSRWEGLPLAPLEAMSEGVVCILSNVTGNAEVIENGKNGLLYDLGNVKALANGISRLLNDEQLWRQYSGDAAKTVRRKFSLDQMINRTYAVYLEMQRSK